MKKFIILLVFPILFSCDGNEPKYDQLTQRVNFLEKENSTLRSQNEELLKKVESCNLTLAGINGLKEKPVLNEVVKEIEKSDNQLIGKWKTPTLYGGGNLTLEKINGVYFKTEKFLDNSVSKVEMTLSIDGNKMIFREKGRKTTDHFDVLKNGKLEVRDKDGLIYVGEII